jgi:hypothetical protein
MADFNFYINRQGIRGLTGAKGDQGYSPQISVIRDTADEYILLVQNENSSFETSNLRGNFVIDDTAHGDMIKYDAENNRLYTGIYRVADHTNFGTVRLATMEDVENPVEDDAVVANVTLLNEVINTYVTQLDTKIDSVEQELKSTIEGLKYKYVTLDTLQTITNSKEFYNSNINLSGTSKITFSDNLGSIGLDGGMLKVEGYHTVSMRPHFGNSSVTADGDTLSLWATGLISLNCFNEIRLLTDKLTNKGNFILDQSNVEQGENITIENTETGIKISATGGGSSGDVTAAGDNVFTGLNNFKNDVSIEDEIHLYSYRDSTQVKGGYISPFAYGTYASGLRIGNYGSQLNHIQISEDGIFLNGDLQTVGYQGEETYVLNQDSIEQGNNITITKTEKGVSISTDLSDLESRVSNIESIIGNVPSIIDDINGEVI